MKQATIVKRIVRLFCALSLTLVLTNCTNVDDTTISESESEKPITDAWICDLKSFEEDYWRYELHMEDNGDYVAVSDTRILKVGVDGTLNSMTPITQPDDRHYTFRIYEGKIYRFFSDNDFQNYDPDKKVELQIYDFDFNLISEHELPTTGLVYDAEIEDENTFGMLVYDRTNFTMTLKRINLNSGLQSEKILSTSGTSPTNIHILETGDYLCTTSSTRKHLYFLDKNLNLIWENEIEDFIISDAAYISGKGIYISGRKHFGNFVYETFVALLDVNGNTTNVVTFDQGERWSPFIGANDERIFVVQTEPETSLNMELTVLDLNLNIESTFQIPGRMVQSDIINNDNGSFSFIYGAAEDLNDTTWDGPTNTRLFKFDDTYTVPTNVIIQ